MPTSNHNKICDLFFISLLLGIPLSIIGVNVSNASKSAIKPGIIKCDDLKLGDRGYIRGIVIDRKKDQWTYQQVATVAESNSCQTLVKFSPNSKMSGLIRPGAKLKMAVKVESDYQSVLLNDDVSTDNTLIPLNGEVPETQTIVKKLGRSLMPEKGKGWTLYLNPYTDKSAVYHFSAEVAKKIEPNVQQRWYIQPEEIGSKSFTVSDVETIEN